jgi:hypothetical protein
MQSPETPKVAEIHEDVTDTAKRLRGTLKERFPGVKFSVRCERFAGGTSIDVDWIDGPTEGAVEAITDTFRSSYFDGMDDSTRMLDPLLIANPDGTYAVIRSGARFVTAKRRYSDEAKAAAGEEIAAVAGDGEPFDLDRHYKVVVIDHDGPSVAYPAEDWSNDNGHICVWRLLRTRDLRPSEVKA